MKAQPVWDLLGCGDQNNMIIHLDGHAVLPSDLEQILDYCDVHLLGIPAESLSGGIPRMKADFFLRDNRDVLDPLFG